MVEDLNREFSRLQRAGEPGPLVTSEFLAATSRRRARSISRSGSPRSENLSDLVWSHKTARRFIGTASRPILASTVGRITHEIPVIQISANRSTRLAAMASKDPRLRVAVAR